MATWHQRRDPGALASLYQPSPRSWRVVINPSNEAAAAIEFSTKRKAERYVSHAKRSGYGRALTLIPPTRYTARNKP